jgi:hypothetical protein
MAWSNSKIFREWLKQAHQVSGTGYTGLDSDTVNVALFTAAGMTPDQDAALASTGYATGVWVSGNQTGGTDANWVAAGRPLASKTFDTTVAVTFFFDAADLAGGGNVTLTGVLGCLVYDDSITAGTIADQGVSYHYFGGAQSVTAGTFTVLWHANGINRYTL